VDRVAQKLVGLVDQLERTSRGQLIVVADEPGDGEQDGDELAWSLVRGKRPNRSRPVGRMCSSAASLDV
jgi:hypothetical protein